MLGQYETTYQSELERWQAVAARDSRASGAFVYAVTSTGIFCRPGCTSRQPKRTNVRFFDDAAQAEKAGFRPCKRCLPDSEQPDAASAIIEAACRQIEQSYDEPTLAELAARAGYSSTHFHRLFRQVTGITPKQYAQQHRRQSIKENLTAGTDVTGALLEAGYGSSSRFYEEASAVLGMEPTRFRDGGVGQRIRYAIGSSYLGRLLVALTDKGVCAIEFGDSESDLIQGLKSSFPMASVRLGGEEVKHWLQQVIDHIELPEGLTVLPLDIQGTAFQLRVWKAIQEIPFGQTASYGDIARRIAQPKASRAVAQACAANPVALAIPCHRVIRQDGRLGGYRWGVERKAAIIEQERRTTYSQQES